MPAVWTAGLTWNRHRYMSDSLGYAALNEENPYPATRDQIETMAKEAGMELHKEQRHTDRRTRKPKPI